LVGTDDLEHLPESAVVLHAELDRPADGMRPDEQHAVVTAAHREEVFEELAVLLERWRREEFLQ
jgi:hypothetical protein